MLLVMQSVVSCSNKKVCRDDWTKKMYVLATDLVK